MCTAEKLSLVSEFDLALESICHRETAQASDVVRGGAQVVPVPAEWPHPVRREPTMTSDATAVPDDLVRAAMAGDRTAVARLLGVVRPLVVRYCRARLGSDPSLSADDVAQEVCIAVLTALPGYRFERRPFLAFVYGIAAHKVIDAHRASTRNRWDLGAEVPDAVDAAESPEQHALRLELSDELRRLLDLLPDKQREVLVLRAALGLSAEETAAAIGSSPGAVRVAQHRALNRLRALAADGATPAQRGLEVLRMVARAG
jgi:RNA polymerase sigma-70 factor, ECF subfamily